MVFTVAVRDTRQWTRRAVLGAGGAGVVGTLTGCAWWDSGSPEPEPPDPLEPLLADTKLLVVRYAHTRAVHPELAEPLAPLEAAHEAHVAALREAIGLPTATPSPTVSPTPSPEVPAEAEDAVAALREAEERGQQQAWQACLEAAPDRAVLLGAICAARASHREVLP